MRPIAHIAPAFVAASCAVQEVFWDAAAMAAVLELHERLDTLTHYCKTLRSLGVDSHAISIACGAANRSTIDGYALVLLVVHGDAPAPPLQSLLARCRAIPVLALVGPLAQARQCEWFDCGVHALVRTPVAYGTLVRQIRALLSLAQPAPSTTERVQPSLTRIERRVLELLASQPGRPFSRSAILGHIYDDHRVVCQRTVDAHIKNLRRKLTTAPGGAVVRAVYGEGYVFESETRVT